MHRLLTALACALPLTAQCYLPEIGADAVSRLTPAAMIDAGHYREAEAVLKALPVPLDPKSAWLLSRAEAALGNLEEALTLAESALAADKSNPDYHVQVAAVSGRLAQKANLLKQMGYARTIKQELDAALALNPANTDAQWGLMMFYYAAPALIGGDKNKAQRIGEQITPKFLSLYYQGRLAHEMKDFDKAESFYKQSASEDPTYYESAAALAKLYIEDKPDPNKARLWACQTVHTDPTRADAWALLAEADTMTSLWSEALEAVRRAEAIDGVNLAPLYGIARGAILRGEQLEMAAANLRKYLAQPPGGNQPSEAEAHMQLGLALEQLGRTEEALAELKLANELDSSLDGLKTALKRVSALKK